jgi:hypothetical protein
MAILLHVFPPGVFNDPPLGLLHKRPLGQGGICKVLWNSASAATYVGILMDLEHHLQLWGIIGWTSWMVLVFHNEPFY